MNIVGKAKVRFHELSTILKEIENVCNSRPLTAVYDDDIIEPLSPNHLIHGRVIATRCEDIANLKETDVSVESFNQRYKHAQSLLEHFWRRWLDEYLKEIREQQPIICRTKYIVLLYNDETPQSL